MQLRLETRPIGEVYVVQCCGRLVSGNEVFTLHSQVHDALEKYGDVVLQLDKVEFIDSSGLGAIMRLVQAARAKGGDMKLCGLTPKIRKILELTPLISQFETYGCMEEAITAAYLGSRYSPGKAGDVRPPRSLRLRFSRRLCLPQGNSLRRRIQRPDHHRDRRCPHPAESDEGEAGGRLLAHTDCARQAAPSGISGNCS